MFKIVSIPKAQFHFYDSNRRKKIDAIVKTSEKGIIKRIGYSINESIKSRARQRQKSKVSENTNDIIAYFHINSL